MHYPLSKLMTKNLVVYITGASESKEIHQFLPPLSLTTYTTIVAI